MLKTWQDNAEFAKARSNLMLEEATWYASKGDSKRAEQHKALAKAWRYEYMAYSELLLARANLDKAEAARNAAIRQSGC